MQYPSFKILASFCSKAGWFGFYLVENPWRHVFARCGSSSASKRCRQNDKQCRPWSDCSWNSVVPDQTAPSRAIWDYTVCSDPTSSVGPDQTAPLRVIWICTVCSDMTFRKLRIIIVNHEMITCKKDVKPCNYNICTWTDSRKFISCVISLLPKDLFFSETMSQMMP